MIFTFGCAGSSLLCVGSLQLWWAGASSPVPGAGFWLWLLLLWSTVSRCTSFGSGAWGPALWPMGWVALWHPGSSQTRGWTNVPCTARQFFTTRPPGKPNTSILDVQKRLKVHFWSLFSYYGTYIKFGRNNFSLIYSGARVLIKWFLLIILLE